MVQWIGNRYKDYPNIIWIMGGDSDGGGEIRSRLSGMLWLKE